MRVRFQEIPCLLASSRASRIQVSLALVGGELESGVKDVRLAFG